MKYQISEIMEILPHRPPFLLVDRIIDGEEGKWAKGIKNVTMNEAFFQGHFPGQPIMPGVLIVEAMAQVGAVAFLSQKEYHDQMALFRGIQNMKFKGQVTPGDQLILYGELIEFRKVMGRAKVEAHVDDTLVAKGEISFALVPKSTL